MSQLPWLHEPVEWRGAWWLPENPQNKKPGFLRYRPEGLELILVGGFDDRVKEEIGPGAWNIVGSRGFPVIHGFASNRKVTLLDSVPTNTKTFGFGFFEGPHEQTILCSRALVGLHAEGPDVAVFDQANCAFEDTARWCGESAISAELQMQGQRFVEGHVHLKPVLAREAVLNGVKVVLSHTLTLPHLDETRRGRTGRVGDDPIFSFEPGEPFALSDALDSILSMRDLMSLATGRAPAVLWIRLYLPTREEAQVDGHVQRPTVDLYDPNLSGGDPHAKALDLHELAFTLDDVAFDEVVTRWGGVREKFHAAANMIIGSRYAADPYVEIMLTTAVSAAEAFHLALKEPLPIPRDELNDLVARAVDAMPDDRKDWIRNVIPRGHSLLQRLTTLAERIPKASLQRLIPDVDTWARETKNARNGLVHRGKSSADIDRLYGLMRITRAVIIVNFLIELGVSEDRIAECVNTNTELSRACHLAWELFPPSSCAS